MQQPSLIPIPEPEGFAEFWQAYPLKVAKFTAKRAYQSAIRKTGLTALLLALEQQKNWRKEMERQKQFVPSWPHPATWLNGERWQDTLITDNQPKSLGPTLKEVQTYANHKWPMENQRSNWAASFYSHWTAKGWKKNGKLLDWQEALTLQVSRWRSVAQNAAPATSLNNATSANRSHD